MPIEGGHDRGLTSEVQRTKHHIQSLAQGKVEPERSYPEKRGTHAPADLIRCVVNKMVAPWPHCL